MKTLPDTLALIDGEILAEWLGETEALRLVEALLEALTDRKTKAFIKVLKTN